MGKYLGEMSPEARHVLSRVMPLYIGPRSARPVDAFSGVEFPQVFDLQVEPGWHQLTLYNTAIAGAPWPTQWEAVIAPLKGRPMPASVGVDLGRASDDGGLGLDPAKSYHCFDFWNDRYLGLRRGSQRLDQDLRPGEARMIAVHEALDRPQFIATDRHVLQGVVDLVRCDWDARDKKLTGTSRLVPGEPYTVVIATNGHRAKRAAAAGAEAVLTARRDGEGLVSLRLLSRAGGETSWEVAFQ